MKTPRLIVLASLYVVLGGCVVGKLVGGMAQNFEYQTIQEVHAAYAGLENHSVAVVVDADMSTLYEHPDVAILIGASVARRLQEQVPGIRVMSPTRVAEWQFRTPLWSALPYGEMAESLGVERIVHIDLYEFRLNPPGNRWLWEGVCAANVGVIEPDGIDPDSFVDTYHVASSFPPVRGVGREGANAEAIRTGLLALFIQQTGWLFYTHFEPKYPDKYQGEVPEYEPEN